MSLISFPLINGIFALIANIGFLLVWQAFRARGLYISMTTRWFVRSFGVLIIAFLMRTSYWDLFMPIFRLLGPEQAAAWTSLTQGRVINVIFILLIHVSIYCALKCRQSMIPIEERAAWPWWLAWRHPKPINFFFFLPWRAR